MLVFCPIAISWSRRLTSRRGSFKALSYKYSSTTHFSDSYCFISFVHYIDLRNINTREALLPTLTMVHYILTVAYVHIYNNANNL